MARQNVLIVDDDRALLRLIAMALEKSGWAVDTADNGATAVQKLSERLYDALLVDLGLPEVPGISVMQHALQKGRCRAVIVITGDDSVEAVVQAMRNGAADFVAKPFEPHAMDAALRRALGISPADTKTLEAWRQTYAPEIIGAHPKLLAALDVTRRVSDTECEVLITGQSGTGKELIAQALHAASARAARPFVAVNCAALPKDLMESELFGHSKGAFTGATERRDGKFQAAHQGTLFLDEIGEMDLGLQAKLLRVVQEKEVTLIGESRSQKVDVRIVSATNRNLLDRCREGTFREDLYFRLNVIPVHLPSLRERAEDIPRLARHFLQQASRRHGRNLTDFDPEALAALEQHPWSGNVRELRNVIERVVILKAEEGPVRASDLPLSAAASPTNAAAGPTMELPAEGLDLNRALNRMEQQLTLDALKRTGGNKAKAAELLGLKRTTLIERMKRLGIEAEADPSADRRDPTEPSSRN